MESSRQERRLKLAAVQAAPVFLDKTATTDRACALIREAGREGADVIGFPETFIPGYPGWLELLPVSTEPAPSLFCKLFNEAVEVPGPEVDALAAACRDANVYAVVGINERRRNTTGTLWNTQLFFGRDGTLLHKHQKYVPTVGERLVHAPGETGSRATVDTDLGGALSGLICGENGNPLAIWAAGLEYPVVHVSAWPPHFCPGQDVGMAAELTAQHTALFSGCFVIASMAVLDDDAIEAYGTTEEVTEYLRGEKGKRRSFIMGPGRKVSEDSEGDLVFAECDVDDLVKVKYSMDYAGHYNRPELFAHLFEKYTK
ncbi:nitrilase/cyanide hydratase and apolipo protein N-acyltransferase [Plectosphaerella plurivora]|uniref:Nitrilase/cyanide hydratase and apolipo protein N-acyltransferase n=1 Tax=Plectosphaerella plurivora TaxID=936078 RepID=A0A9P8VIV7_9PEZI|nr:nitrilase/cyanide hydratase and apolipo protein N-acyltransferase [Plectosphaerella plurivora]